MNIAVDIDDTLTESFDYFLPCVAEYFGVSESELREKNISYSNLSEEWKKDEIGFCKAYYDKMAADTPFKSGAAEAVRRLHELGHKIIIITGRTKEFYTDPYETTRRELANGGIIYDKLICTLNKAEACVFEKISVLVDDMIANCDAAAKMGIDVILFESKANMDIKTDFRKVSDWEEAFSAIFGMEHA